MTFSWVREGGIEGERRREHDGDQVEGGIMIVPGYDRKLALGKPEKTR
jgi:hypothetical protein